MDEADRGNHQAELTLQAYIERVKQRAGKDLQVRGYCLNCEETCESKLFCSVECRDDYDKRALLQSKLREQ
jgi:hypothetical protein